MSTTESHCKTDWQSVLRPYFIRLIVLSISLIALTDRLDG